MPDHPLPLHIVRIKKLKSLLAMIENSIKGGDNYFFRNLFAEEDGKEVDILENGSNSCAAFVSWILLSLELIKHPHATVFGTTSDLLASGWFEIKELKPGAILIWEKRDGAMLEDQKIPKEHMGFYFGNDEAISNDSKGTGFPCRHHVTYNNTRKIEKILWHPALEEDIASQ
ncbi:MAG: hypothetical protein A2735_03385 [Candidatus Yanofskybacteria bacterium RIFCSPHIGHO2_01_FULL_41_21]|uniref:NlpC/P60 domain-containing protein n=1 Tax=Candidatus Yanofskybacteria bacterium RIFCSPHIGHO2_01_FULL_41_21 TaxID=1802660 RepID=A0A1F8EA10_9BACT|nr:MAG: hypothetical protein A2735_03385 [Candidatus Yanofskybacteria bacterium RIFCSPHIGHO2_01_FULL_41_21]